MANTEITVVWGLGLLAGIFSYMAFEFLHKTQADAQEQMAGRSGLHWEKIIGIMCFILAITFVNMLMYALVLIAQNTGMTYLSDTVLVVGMQVVMWATLGSMAIYLLFLTLSTLYFIYDNVMSWWKGRGKGVVE